jgi:hypothetical protein
LIGPKWEFRKGERHIDKVDDIVRFEIECALAEEAKGRPLFPLLIGTDKLPKPLPPSIERLADIHYKQGPAAFDSQREFLELIADIYKRADAHRPKPIALLSSTLSFFGGGDRTEGLDYFTTLVMTIIQQLKSYNRDVILKVPIYAADDALLGAAHHQLELLLETLENIDSYCALIVAPFKLEYLAKDLARLMKDIKDSKRRFPVFTIDKAYVGKEAEEFQKHGVAPPPGFICNGEFDGGLAASSIIAYVKRAHISAPNVVVLQGLEGSQPRILGFLQRIAEYNATITSEADEIYVAVSIITPFLPEDAKERAEQFLSDEDSWTELIDSDYEIQNPQRQPRRVDAFFCCNDEMALGVCEYLEGMPPGTNMASPVVVGFDGIASVRRRIARPDHWLLNTVDVKVRKQVDGLVKALLDGLEGRGVLTETQMIPGELFNSLDEQSKHVKRIVGQRAKTADTPEAQTHRQNEASLSQSGNSSTDAQARDGEGREGS